MRIYCNNDEREVGIIKRIAGKVFFRDLSIPEMEQIIAKMRELENEAIAKKL